MALSTLYLLSYNNYFNRTVKKLNTLSDYLPYVNISLTDVNFKPNDSVITYQIVNLNNLPESDYLIVDTPFEPLSRWFITECVRLSDRQYRLTLRRDVVADNFDVIINSPCFIEKATVDYNNDLIFNSENMSYNQIKKSETLIKDMSNTPWIIGYYTQPKDSSGNEVSVNGNIIANPNIDYYLTAINSTDWQYNKTTPFISNEKSFINYSFNTALVHGVFTDHYFYKFNVYGDLEKNVINNNNGGFIVSDDYYKTLLAINIYKAYNYVTLEPLAKSLLNVVSTNDLLKYRDKIIQFKDGTFKVVITESDYDDSKFVNSTDNKALYDELYEKTYSLLSANGVLNPTIANDKNKVFKCYVKGKAYTVELKSIATAGNKYLWEIPVSSNKLTDNPYKMFALPLNSVKITGEDLYLTTKDDLCLNISIDIAKVLGAGCYDLQLLPYCPITEILSDESGKLDLTNAKYNVDYSFIMYEYDKPSGDNPTTKEAYGVMFFPKVSSFTNRINLETPVTVTEPKIQSECDLYRLCSPNYSGVFEFNAAKNGGINSFDVDCTYIPYNPYIHVTPDFNRLYGKDFNDNRGLICGGNFSLATISDAWINYQIQNKNYNEIFQSKITNMEYKNNMSLVSDIANAVTGTVGAGMSAGSAFGPAGAIAGATVSAAAGVADVFINQDIRKRDLQLEKDLYGYQLGNIKALPDGLSKTTAYNINNKYYPFLEYYSCSDVEKEALRSKIKYNGMTIMSIGYIKDYIANSKYIKGQMIKINDLNEDSNMSNAIYSEINRGLYIGGDD